MTNKANAELADYYNDTEDLSGFDDANAVPVTVKRSVTISVRFSDKEIAELRARAEQAGVKVPHSSARPRWRQRAPWTESHSASLPVTWSSELIRSPSS